MSTICSHGLRLAAAPTFALMALLTAAFENGAPEAMCGAMHRASPLGGMMVMYALMSAFHITPWLTLLSGRPVSSPHQHTWSYPHE